MTRPTGPERLHDAALRPLLDTDHPDYGRPETGSWTPELPGITVGQLREARAEYPEDVIIRVAQQPSYPLRARITNLMRRSNSEGNILWIATREVSDHNESPYAPRSAWDGDNVEDLY
jgi:hypothetical protein